MQTDSMTIAALIEREGITADVEWADSNPNMSDMPSGSTHWLVTLRRGDESMRVPFSQGPAIDREPDAEHVLSCLADDAGTLENAPSFDDWASELGFFPMESEDDYRKARQTFEAVERQTEELRQLMGDSFDALLWDTERL